MPRRTRRREGKLQTNIYSRSRVAGAEDTLTRSILLQIADHPEEGERRRRPLRQPRSAGMRSVVCAGPCHSLFGFETGIMRSIESKCEISVRPEQRKTQAIDWSAICWADMVRAMREHPDNEETSAMYCSSNGDELGIRGLWRSARALPYFQSPRDGRR